MRTWDIPNQKKISCLAFETSGYYYNEGSDRLIYADINVLNGTRSWPNDAVGDGHHLCRAGLQNKIRNHTQAAVLVRCQGAGIMKFETHCSIVERRCFMTTRCLMNTLPGKLLHVHIANLTEKPVDLPRFLRVASTSNAFTCIVHTCDHKTRRLVGG